MNGYSSKSLCNKGLWRPPQAGGAFVNGTCILYKAGRFLASTGLWRTLYYE